MSKTIKEQIEIMQHYANGNEVEIFKDGKWSSITNTGFKVWNFATFDFRIKEQKKTITIKKWLVQFFEATNESLRLATEEIDRLNKALDIKDICIKSLEIKEKELSDKIYSLYDNIAEVNQLNCDNYQAWLKEHETNGKLSIALTIMSLVIFGLSIFTIGVLLK